MTVNPVKRAANRAIDYLLTHSGDLRKSRKEFLTGQNQIGDPEAFSQALSAYGAELREAIQVPGSRNTP